MKRFIICFLLIAVLHTLQSCSQEPKLDLLEYQNSAAHSVTLRINGEEYRADIDRSVPDCTKLTLTSPDDLSGFGIYLASAGAELERDGVRVPIKIKGMLKYIPSLFSLTEDMIEDTSRESFEGIDCIRATAKTQDIEVTLMLKADDGEPIVIKAQSGSGSSLEMIFEEANTNTY